jgi:hypothetical protein
MSAKKRILKAAGYAAAPKLAFLANNPGKGAAAWAGKQVVERMLPDRFRPEPRRSSFGMTAAKGLGAAALAAPLGWWLGRRIMEREG